MRIVISNSKSLFISSTSNATVYFDEEMLEPTSKNCSAHYTTQVPPDITNDNNIETIDVNDEDLDGGNNLGWPDLLEDGPSFLVNSFNTRYFGAEEMSQISSSQMDGNNLSQCQSGDIADTATSIDEPQLSYVAPLSPVSPTWTSWCGDRNDGSDCDELELSDKDGGHASVIDDDPLGLAEVEEEISADEAARQPDYVATNTGASGKSAQKNTELPFLETSCEHHFISYDSCAKYPVRLNAVIDAIKLTNQTKVFSSRLLRCVLLSTVAVCGVQR